MTGNWFGASLGNWFGRSGATVYAPPITLPQLFAHTEIASLRVVQRLAIEHSFVVRNDAVELTGPVNVPVVTFDSIAVAAPKRQPRRSYGRRAASPAEPKQKAFQKAAPVRRDTAVTSMAMETSVVTSTEEIFIIQTTSSAIASADLSREGVKT
ncbi:MAG TPA: hypothetical protein PK782_14330 [Nitrospira sp.]|nr:hypothetical protein [Nitrospira sp.]HNC78534.1 hypothetical protein [Rhodocyclaceae bacterium]HND03251.1 hypothetical protein [Nitrospira sp.]HNG03879.1 hypothetical protein [Nitrospira sp.]HNG53974.1 hypothetical protein [Nitrospira sp.]